MRIIFRAKKQLLSKETKIPYAFSLLGFQIDDIERKKRFYHELVSKIVATYKLFFLVKGENYANCSVFAIHTNSFFFHFGKLFLS